MPKIHKENVPLGPILSVIGSAEHELAKWLGESLSQFVIKDSFTFAEAILATTSTSADNVMASFDIQSFFINVSLMETIDILYVHIYYITVIWNIRRSQNKFLWN